VLSAIRNSIELIKSDDTRVIISDGVSERRKSAGNSLCQIQVLRPASSQPCVRTYTYTRYSRTQMLHVCEIHRWCARGCRWRVTRSGKANEEGLKREPHVGGNARLVEREERKAENCVEARCGQPWVKRIFVIETKVESVFQRER